MTPAERQRRVLAHVPGAEGRSCGSCSACCTALAVVERLKKPAGERCKHLTTTEQCAIYHCRPLDCAGYFCAWRLGPARFHDDERPDRTGVVLTPRFLREGGMCLTAQGITDQAVQDAREYLEGVSDRLGVPILMKPSDELYRPSWTPELLSNRTWANRSGETISSVVRQWLPVVLSEVP